MKKNITIFGLLYLLIGLTIVNFAQTNKNVTNINVQPPQISGGAEYSIFLEEQKKLGNKSIFYDQSKSVQVPTGVEGTTAISTIEGINFDENAANSGNYSIPPDPNGAIGTNHLVSVTNTSIEWFSKSGTQLNSQSLKSFFTSLTPLTNTFDPKVIFDQYENRFVVVTLERVLTGTTSSRILVAVSANSDPTGTWYFHSINSKISIGGFDHWADYPGFAVSNEAVYITNNMFRFSGNSYGGTRLWILDKGVIGGFYGGGTGLVNVFDPFSAWPTYAMTIQPSHMFGTSPAGIGIYLVGYNRLSGGGNSALQIITASNSLTSPTFSQNFVFFGVADNFGAIPNAPQLGSTILVSTNDPRTYNAVWRNNNLYTSTIVVPPSGPDAGQVTAHWVQTNTTDYSLIDNGNIGGEDIGAGTFTFFPSIAVNAIGEIMVGFAASGPTIYPGAYYTFRFPYDAPGTVQSSKTLKAGIDYYYRRFGGTDNRWGDYSGSSVDPTNDLTFCLFNEYAMTRGTELLPDYPGQDGRWGTVFGIMPTLDLTVMLEGPYNGTGSMTTFTIPPLTQPYNAAPWNYQGQESIPALLPNIFDWVLVTLRKDLNPGSPDPATAVKVAQRAGLINILGKIVELDGTTPLGFSVEPGDYYVVVEHRNHLAIMSPTKVTLN